MKRVSALLASAAATIPMSAAAQDRPLTGEQLRQLAARQAVLCENWDPQRDRCDAIYRWNALDGGATFETRLESVRAEPSIDMALQYRFEIRGDSACMSLDPERFTYLFIVAERELPSAEAAGMRDAVKAVYAPAAGRTVCTTYYRDGDSLRTEATVDGRRRPELDSVLRLHGDARLPGLRPLRQPWTAGVIAAAPPVPEAAPAPAAR